MEQLKCSSLGKAGRAPRTDFQTLPRSDSGVRSSFLEPGRTEDLAADGAVRKTYLCMANGRCAFFHGRFCEVFELSWPEDTPSPNALIRSMAVHQWQCLRVPGEQGPSHCAGSSVRVGSGAVCLVKTNGLLGRIQTHTAVQLEKAVQLGIKQQVMNYKVLCVEAAVNG